MIFIKRVFLVVLDGVGIGEMDDAALYNDKGANTLLSVSKSKYFSIPNLVNLGLFNVDSIPIKLKVDFPLASFAKMKEISKGKDTLTGHFEMAGLEISKPFSVFPNGFSHEIIERFESLTGHKVVCNKPYSGISVIKDFGEHHIKTKDLIVYTSADSVFQVAAHENIIPIEKLYKFCETARSVLTKDYNIARIIARPFTGSLGCFKRVKRKDYSVLPHDVTMLDQLKSSKFDVIAVGKIGDIFTYEGVTAWKHTSCNKQGIDDLIDNIQNNSFEGLYFLNLSDFDTLYGHRNDFDGFAKALSKFDKNISLIINSLKKEDMLIITADHGCDPCFPSTDHSREHVPLLVCGPKIKKGVNLGIRSTFSDVGSSILNYFGIKPKIKGTSFLDLILPKEEVQT